jgi:hypothetical protein
LGEYKKTKIRSKPEHDRQYEPPGEIPKDEKERILLCQNQKAQVADVGVVLKFWQKSRMDLSCYP